MKFKTGWVLFLGLALFSSCKHQSKDDNSLFQTYYLEFQKNNHSEYDSLLAYYHRIDSVSYRQNSTLLLFLKETTRARLLFREAEYAKSNRQYLQANSMLENTGGTDSLRALNYMGIGLNYMNMGTFDSTFAWFGKAQEIYDSLNNTKMSQVIQANRAQAYYNKREPDKALAIIDQLAREDIRNTTLLTTQHLKANILGSSGKTDSAILLDRQIIQHYGNDKNNYQISSFYNNLGICYFEKGMIDSALFYCKKSYELDSIAGIKMHMGANLVLMGDISKKNDRNAAKEYYQKALQIFAEDRNIDKKYWIFGTLAKTAREENDLLQLAAYQDSMLNTFQKMNNLSSNRTIELLKIEYETDKKNQQIKNQGIQLRGQQITLLLIGTISLLILIALYLYFQNRDRKNQLRMAEQDRKVSVMVIEAEQNERSRIARDLHDSVSQKLAVMKMHLSMVETAQTESMDKINSMLQQTITEVRAISHNLYPRDLEKGIIPALELLCEQHNFVNSDINFSLHTDASVATSRLSKNIELVIYRIVQEITTNTLKYSGAKQVRIELSVHNGTITIRIADDGIGFNPESPDNAKGIGLKNITERIKQISGKITIRSKEEEGTQFHIEIPT